MTNGRNSEMSISFICKREKSLSIFTKITENFSGNFLTTFWPDNLFGHVSPAYFNFSLFSSISKFRRWLNSHFFKVYLTSDGSDQIISKVQHVCVQVTTLTCVVPPVLVSRASCCQHGQQESVRKTQDGSRQVSFSVIPRSLWILFHSEHPRKDEAEDIKFSTK